MNGSLVYTATNLTSTDGTVSIGHHTSCLYVWNKNNTTSAIIELNGKYQIVIPHSPNTGSHVYHTIPGDYTSIKVVTTAVDFSVYAIG